MRFNFTVVHGLALMSLSEVSRSLWVSLLDRKTKWKPLNDIITGFTSKKYPSECRAESSHFIRLLCHSSVLTLQMFIS